MLGTGADSARPAGGGGEGEGYQARFLSPEAEGPAQVARCRYHRAVAVVQAGGAAEGDHRAAERLARLRLSSCRLAHVHVCTLRFVPSCSGAFGCRHSL